MKKKTKILATIGPASDSLEILEKLIKAGVNVFRLNFSHGTHKYHSATIKKIRDASKNVNIKVGVLQDICGPKVRVGKLKSDFYLKKGDRVIFTKENIEGEKIDNNSYKVCINQPNILDMIKENEYIYMCDGSIRAKVISLNGDIVTQIDNDGKLSSNKGVNFPNTVINIEIITPKDEKDLLWGSKHEVDFVAISFVQNAKDVIHARNILESYGSKSQVFSKIEKFDAVENLKEILEVSDGIMVARGDLGIEVPYSKVPTIQKKIIRMANSVSKPVITATQMLLSMTEHDMATRAEISDVANAVLDGTDAVMLSEESAIGINPVNAVEVMSNTIIETEKIYSYNKFGKFDYLDNTDIITASVAKLARNLKAKAILSLTSSGKSAKKLARYRIKNDIYAITHSERVARLLTITWGVYPIMNIDLSSSEEMLGHALQKGYAKGFIDKNRTYIVTAGYPAGIEGSTNFLHILKKEQIEHYLSLAI
ncbi:MAG: pyruvate kinase [Sulfurospirillum sp.]|nr:pyruvate kinase [Sulfurospirillum sp.]